jgi:FdhD protein
LGKDEEAREVPARVWREGWRAGGRLLAEEVPVALSHDGTTQAVMMATPADLEEFGLGFSLTEGIAGPGEILEVAVVDLGDGIDVQMTLAAGAGARLAARRRRMAGPVGCGLCGLDSIEAVLGEVRPVAPGGLRLAPAEVGAAMAALARAQRLHDATRSVHAAGLWRPGAGLVLAREDVGRHNAVDKLAGAALRAGVPMAGAAVVVTSRVSIDLVQKVAAMGAAALIAASAPTARAVALAEAAGLTLVGLVRGEGFELFAHPGRVGGREAVDVV